MGNDRKGHYENAKGVPKETPEARLPGCLKSKEQTSRFMPMQTRGVTGRAKRPIDAADISKNAEICLVLSYDEYPHGAGDPAEAAPYFRQSTPPEPPTEPEEPPLEPDHLEEYRARTCYQSRQI